MTLQAPKKAEKTAKKVQKQAPKKVQKAAPKAIKSPKKQLKKGASKATKGWFGDAGGAQSLDKWYGEALVSSASGMQNQ